MNLGQNLMNSLAESDILAVRGGYVTYSETPGSQVLDSMDYGPAAGYRSEVLVDRKRNIETFNKAVVIGALTLTMGLNTGTRLPRALDMVEGINPSRARGYLEGTRLPMTWEYGKASWQRRRTGECSVEDRTSQHSPQHAVAKVESQSSPRGGIVAKLEHAWAYLVHWPQRSAARQALHGLRSSRPEQYDALVAKYKSLGAAIAERYGFSESFVSELERSLHKEER